MTPSTETIMSSWPWRTIRQAAAIAGLVGDVQRFDTLAAAAVDRVLADERAFAVALIGNDEQGIAVVDCLHADHIACARQLHSDATAGATGGPEVVDSETGSLALVGHKEDV
ncbi:MAG: hypothetical protein R3C29_03235 [Dehalococcoidia bacterium]